MEDYSSVFLFGGSGCLGNFIISKYIQNKNIDIFYNFSRDDHKHWNMDNIYNSPKLKHIIGDIYDINAIENALFSTDPKLIIIMSALKHVDRCEDNPDACLNVNLIGIKNILNTLTKYQNILSNLKSVLFISTDKACSPINIYGMCKSIAEKLISAAAIQNKRVKFVTLRYGNVLNSTSSILPNVRQKINQGKNLKITDERMTRYFMTLEDCEQLINYSLLQAKSGEIVIPKLPAMKILDFLSIFAEKYNVQIENVGLRPGEKLHESLINENQSLMTIDDDKYYRILPYREGIQNSNPFEYRSDQNILSKNQLRERLISLEIL